MSLIFRDFAVIIISILLLAVAGVVSSYIGLYGSLFVLNENQILYLFSSSPQVLAGIYGLTLTGFIFFRTELDRDVLRDATLVEVVDLLKVKYYRLLLFITILVGVAVALCNLVMAYESSGDLVVLSVFMNVGQSTFVVTLLVIGYFVFNVISPDRFKAASRELQHIVDPGDKGDEPSRGSLSDFLREYNSIEGLMQEWGKESEVTSGSPSLSIDKFGRRYISNARLADMLYRSEKIDFEMLSRLKKLITLRNTIIHGADPVVSLALVDEAREVNSELAIRLKK